MKLKKVTNSDGVRRPRWYNDACGTALGLELLGERWSLLIVRELMFGGRRFGDLRASLPGVSANILTQRLEGLEASGILIRNRLPPPALVWVYELTPWGRETETVIIELGRWAVRSPAHDPTLPISAASLMLSFRAMLARDRAAGLRSRLGFRFGEEGFVGELDDGLAIRRAEPEGDVVFDTDPATLGSIVYGGRPIADAEAAGALRLDGDRGLAERFVRLFPLPPKVEMPVPEPGAR
jgi:DNA-binding HxlR family transcriptional regulator